MIYVSIIARNEADRHLERTLACAREIGPIRVTDDASTDRTVELCKDYGAVVQETDTPLFWGHEGRARQRHYDFSTAECKYGDWVLSLDADETVNHPNAVRAAVDAAEKLSAGHVLLPLYEFWTPTQYRVDGYWFGTKACRLYRWQPGGWINDRDMGCGSEPTYVPSSPPFNQEVLHLLHWGYVRDQDRARKHEAYTSRLGGHGHNMDHVNSIVTEPMLADYSF